MSLAYLLASLPMVSLEAPPVLTADAFLEACEPHLTTSELAGVQALLANESLPNAKGYVGEWFDGEAQIRNAIARHRATVKGIDPARYTRSTKGCAVWLLQGVEAAFAERTPLAREEALDRLRWQLAQTLAGVSPLDSRNLYAYAVQLGIAIRRAKRNPQLGRQTLQQLADVPLPL